ncbi:MAG TPA: glutamine--fructose-6-phosphate transaminase (isomerizing) [archaeon]|jgi:glucosamine--fructose-6-phosphate aminotransferase (isomerizing)|nr:glutamine--fructose-6-phosphate transaminase (isomerizing) [archaeon]
MCGISAYFGKKDCVPILINGIKRLEYRGYDSCGLAVIDNKTKELKIIKAKGKIINLEEEVKKNNPQANIGIAHTRWATHGEPNVVNAHPQTDCKGNIALVHNGIIENFETLKKFLEKEGHVFKSETDTEVLAHLIEKFYSGDLKKAVQKTLKKVVGSFGLVVMDKQGKELIVARCGSPIIIGIGEDEYFVASDISAIIEHTKKVIYLEDNEIACINGGCEITSLDNITLDKETTEIEMNLEEIEKQGYKHFMLKEIHEQPETIKQAILGRIDFENNTAKLGGINLTTEQIKNIKRIIIVACGTSWHCGLVAKFSMEGFLRIPVEVDYASEFRYRNPIIDNNTLVIAISQSGETADTLAAVREAKKKGAKVIGIVNVVGSTIARECDGGIYIRAGPEIGVASTKAFTSQLVCLNLLTLYIGRIIESIDDSVAKKLINNLLELPQIVRGELKKDNENKIKEIAKEYFTCKNALYLGRGINYPIALEGALKLKEISYIHAEGYPAAEMKHGPIALIDEGLPVVVIANSDLNYEKVLSNIHEAKARGARIIALATQGDEEIEKLCNHVIFVPSICTNLTPFVNVIPMQLLAYYIADLKNCPIDQPRNLAKSVTVE